ncbi:hypothetical protein JR065_02085 [Xanthomonas sp. AmX2]|uniref:hypothetical protein n=1 Tax=Xanthomonas sp. TaxID=29446 RepID=UPI00197D4300|nr:hypothetical protein [Xanthomonas sp.]MBN6149116.1 hypothetical protein [Xanthomonas sp.]
MKALRAPRPGDLFYVPAVDATDAPGFVIARYIELIPPALGHLIEVFADFHTHIPASMAQVDTSRRLFRPILCSLRFPGMPRWKILFSDPAYARSDSGYDRIQFAFDTDLWIGGASHPATADRLAGVEPSVCWRMDHVMFRVIAHLRGAIAENACMEHFALPDDLRVDSEVARERVRKAAHGMQTLLGGE